MKKMKEKLANHPNLILRDRYRSCISEYFANNLKRKSVLLEIADVLYDDRENEKYIKSAPKKNGRRNMWMQHMLNIDISVFPRKNNFRGNFI